MTKILLYYKVFFTSEISQNENLLILWVVEEALSGVPVVEYNTIQLLQEIGKGGFGLVFKYVSAGVTYNTIFFTFFYYLFIFICFCIIL